MPSEPLPNTTVASRLQRRGGRRRNLGSGGGLPVELSEFSQRLASFGLGEAPDPLLTRGPPPEKRRSRP